MTQLINILNVSSEEAQPIELFEFTYGAEVYRYCTGGQDVFISGQNWNAEDITRDGFDRTDNMLAATLKIQLSRLSELGSRFAIGLNDFIVDIKVYRADRSVTDESILTFVGKITAVESDELSVKINADPYATAIKRNVFTPKFQRMCRHRLYGTQCGVNRLDYEFETTVVSVEKNYITLASINISGDHYLWGECHFAGSRRMITKITGNTLSLSRKFDSIKIGDTVRIYAGCDLSRSTCHAKFNNVVNYGGFDFIPSKNPFSGVRVY